MKAVAVKITRIGRFRGVRLPAGVLKRHGIDDNAVLEERSEGILLRAPGRAKPKLSWSETAAEMGAPAEDWSEWDVTSAGATCSIPWEPAKVRPIAGLKSRHSAPGKARRG